MRNLITTLIMFLCACAQAQNSVTTDHVRARASLRIGPANSVAATAIRDTMPAAPGTELLTAEAIFNAIAAGGGGGGGGAVITDATLSGNGSIGTPLKVAQQSALTSQGLAWTGATWAPSWGNPYTFVTSGSTITTAVNEILIGTISADITMGLPTCNATNDSKHFKFVRNGVDAFSVTIDPSGAQLFGDGTSLKIFYGKISIDCTCRFSAGTGTIYFDNF